MKKIGEALEQMMPAFRPVGVERVTLLDALGRYAASAVPARYDLPPFDNSAMDGYAVRASEALQDAELAVVGESKAGGPTPQALQQNAAMRIFTGAAMPSGADTVVMQENTKAQEGKVTFTQAADPNRNVRKRASDLAAGEAMVPAGMRVGAGEIGLLASQRVATVNVFRRPVVAILSTGDELRDISDPVEPGTIVNSNAYALAAQVREAGGVPWVIPNVPDDLEVMTSRVQEGLSADLLITCGGASVGEYDFMRQVFDAVGVGAGFWKVRVKPGKPLIFGKAGDKPVVGLPGNPVSAMVTFEVFVRPGIRAMIGDPKPHRVRREVVLAKDHRHSPRRPELARARLSVEGGQAHAHLLRLQGSGSLPSMVGVDALVMLPAEVAQFKAGERLAAIGLRDEEGASVAPFDD